MLCHNLISLPLLALTNSGAEQNFLDANLVSQAGINSVPLDSPMRVCALDGRVLAQASHQTEPLHLILSGNHCEYLQFFFSFLTLTGLPEISLVGVRFAIPLVCNPLTLQQRSPVSFSPADFPH